MINCGKFNSFHAVFFDLKPLWYWIKIECVFNRIHAGWSLIRGESVLRVSIKETRNVSFVKVLEAEAVNDTSKRHVKFFTDLFKKDLGVKNQLEEKDKKGVRIHVYRAVNKLW